jgi:hypothetical protein
VHFPLAPSIPQKWTSPPPSTQLYVPRNARNARAAWPTLPDGLRVRLRHSTRFSWGAQRAEDDWPSVEQPFID